MFADMDAAVTDATTEYVCLNGCGFSTTTHREFQRHRRDAGHEHHGVNQHRWPR